MGGTERTASPPHPDLPPPGGKGLRRTSPLPGGRGHQIPVRSGWAAAPGRRFLDPSQRFSPAWATIALFIPIANWVSFYNTGHRVRKMQQACGDVNTINPVTALILAILFGIGYILMLQSNLNDHWEMHGRGRKP